MIFWGERRIRDAVTLGNGSEFTGKTSLDFEP